MVGGSALPPLWRRVGAPMFSPAMSRSPTSRPRSAALGRLILPALPRSPRIAFASRPPRLHSPARSTAAPSGWNPHTPSLNPGCARRGSCPDASAPLGTHLRAPAEVSPRPLFDLVADPSEGSHRPVKFLLVLQAIPPRPSVLTQGLASQVGNLRGLMDCSLFPVGSGLFLQFPKHSLRRWQQRFRGLFHLSHHAVNCCWLSRARARCLNAELGDNS